MGDGRVWGRDQRLCVRLGRGGGWARQGGGCGGGQAGLGMVVGGGGGGGGGGGKGGGGGGGAGMCVLASPTFKEIRDRATESKTG